MKISRTKIEIIMAGSGLTKKEMADRANLCPKNINKILNRGTCEPRTAGKIAKALGVAVTEIMESDCE